MPLVYPYAITYQIRRKLDSQGGFSRSLPLPVTNVIQTDAIIFRSEVRETFVDDMVRR